MSWGDSLLLSFILSSFPPTPSIPHCQILLLIRPSITLSEEYLPCSVLHF